MLSFHKKLKNGEYMTRICALANRSELCVSADSLYTNNLNDKTSINNIKISYNSNIIVALLGTSELFTAQGVVSIRKIIQDFLDEHQEGCLETMYQLQDLLVELCRIYRFVQPCLIMYFWKQDNRFYMYYFDVCYYSTNTFGDNVAINSNLKPVTKENMHLYNFFQFFISAGDGLTENPIIEKIEEPQNLLDISAGTVQQAVLDDSIPTVGGPVYSICMDLEGNITTYRDGIHYKW